MHNRIVPIITAFVLLFLMQAHSQPYKGIWLGHITQYNSPYSSGYVLHIKENQGEIISGRAYIYRRELFMFQGVFDFIGTAKNSICRISELKILDEKFQEAPDWINLFCIKNMDLKYSYKEPVSYLRGKWSGSSVALQVCAPGDVFLRKYDPAVTADTGQIPAPVLKLIQEDRSNKIKFLNTALSTPIILNVSRPFVSLEIRDYMKEDLDTVSVYYNRRPVLSRLGIGRQAKTVMVRLDKMSGLNEIIMYAENLGQIPPNTSTLVVDDGRRKQKVNIESTRQTSAVVYLRYKPY